MGVGVGVVVAEKNTGATRAPKECGDDNLVLQQKNHLNKNTTNINKPATALGGQQLG